MAMRYTHVLAAGRRGGKTLWIVEWAKKARHIDNAPGWDRVIIAHCDAMRHIFVETYGLDPKQVYTVAGWQQISDSVDDDVEIAVDEAGLILQNLLGRVPHKVTITTRNLCECDV